jgi:hypothetical protein
MNAYLDDDENVKAMRETARQVGLTQLLLNIHHSDQYGIEEIEKFHSVFDLLGVSDAERKAP